MKDRQKMLLALATFSRAVKVFAEERVPDAIHVTISKENYTEKMVGHAGIDSTAIVGREKACRNLNLNNV